VRVRVQSLSSKVGFPAQNKAQKKNSLSSLNFFKDFWLTPPPHLSVKEPHPRPPLIGRLSPLAYKQVKGTKARPSVTQRPEEITMLEA
jgi:hypothetical protein